MKKPKGLRLRGNIWWIDVCVNGTRYRQSLGIPTERQKEAEESLSEFWKEVALGNLNIEKKEKNPPLKTLFDSYLEIKEKEVCEGQYKQVYSHLNSFLNDLGYKYVNDIIPKEVTEWLHRNPHRNKAQKMQININAALCYGLAVKLIKENPLANIPRVKHKCKKRKALTQEQYIEFSKHIWDYSCGNLLFFIMKTGCRFSEAALLKWEDVSLLAEKAIISAENNKTDEFTDNLKELPLAEDLVLLLTYLKKENVKLQDYVFTTSKGKPFLKDNVRRTVIKIGAKIGRPDFTTHAFRNTVTTLSLNSRANPRDVQFLLGHKKASTTAMYDNDDFSRKKAAVNNLPSVQLPFTLAS